MRNKKIIGLLLALFLCVGWMEMQQVLSSEAAQIRPANPQKVNGDVLWDCVWFGEYYLEEGTEVKKPVKWRVLSVDGQDAFLLSDAILDAGAFHDAKEAVTWKDSYLRTWLNGGFLHCAFSLEEKQAILKTNVVTEKNPDYATPGGETTQDFVYLLSAQEAARDAYGFSGSGYYGDGRGAKNTAYAASGGTQGECMRPEGKCDWWWLRSPGFDAYHTAQVLDTGYVASYGSAADYRKCGIRPALHLDLSKTSVWSYAGRTNLAGEQIDLQTPQPPADTQPPQKEPDPEKPPKPNPVTPPNNVSAPKRVKITSVRKSGKNILVKWKKTSCSGYQVLISTDKTFKKNKKSYFVHSSKTVKKSIKPWKGNRTYYVKVRAYKKSGKSKVYGDYSQKKSIKYKAAKKKK